MPSCDVCSREAAFFCSRCHSGRYCSRLCQQTGYAAHKTSCKGLLALAMTSDILKGTLQPDQDTSLDSTKSVPSTPFNLMAALRIASAKLSNSTFSDDSRGHAPPRGSSVAELLAALQALNSCALVPADCEDGPSWSSFFSSTWYPTLRARPSSALAPLWHSATLLKIRRYPLSQEAAQRSANWATEDITSLWGSADDSSSLHAAAVCSYSSAMEPFFALLESRDVEDSVLHGNDPDSVSACHECRGNADPTKWFGCNCLRNLRSALGHLGIPRIPSFVCRPWSPGESEFVGAVHKAFRENSLPLLDGTSKIDYLAMQLSREPFELYDMYHELVYRREVTLLRTKEAKELRRASFLDVLKTRAVCFASVLVHTGIDLSSSDVFPVAYSQCRAVMDQSQTCMHYSLTSGSAVTPIREAFIDRLMSSTQLYVRDRVIIDTLCAKVVVQLGLPADVLVSTASAAISDGAVVDVGGFIKDPVLSEASSHSCDGADYSSAVQKIPRYWVIALGARGLPVARNILSVPFYGAFGHAQKAEDGMKEFQRRLNDSDLDSVCGGSDDFDVLFRDVLVVSVLSGSIRRVRWALQAIALHNPNAASEDKLALSAMAAAGRAGHLALLQWLAALGKIATMGFREYERATRDAIRSALQGGHIPVLSWHWMNERGTWSNPHRDFAMSWDIEVSDFDSESSSYEYVLDESSLHAPGVIQWGVSIGLATHFPESMLVAAVLKGQLEDLKCIFMKDGCFSYDYFSMPSLMTTAVQTHQLDIVKWLRSSGSCWDYRVLLSAVNASNHASLTGLHFILKHDPPIVPTEHQLPIIAAAFCNPSLSIAITKLLLENGFSLNAQCFELMAKETDDVDVLSFLSSAACSRGTIEEQAFAVVAAVRRSCLHRGRLAMLDALHSSGFPLTVGAFTAACTPSSSISCFGLPVLDWLWTHKCEINTVDATMNAVRRPHYVPESYVMVTLKWLFDHNSLGLSAEITAAAAIVPSPAVLSFLIEHECPVDASIGIAVLNAHRTNAHYTEKLFCEQFDVLLPHLTLSAELAAIAAALPSSVGLKILGALLRCACPVDENVLAAAARAGRLDTWRWLVDSSLCPWDSHTACASFEACDRAVRRKQPAGATRTEADAKSLRAMETHRAWLTSSRGGSGCPCGGLLHALAAPDPADTCLICCDSIIGAADPLVLRCEACAVFFHTGCVDAWIASRVQGGAAGTCAHCRAAWKADERSVTTVQIEARVQLQVDADAEGGAVSTSIAVGAESSGTGSVMATAV